MSKSKKTPPDLGDFEGSPVIGTALILRKTGDGWSTAMELDPTRLHVGEVFCFGGEAEVTSINHPTADKKSDSDEVIRVHVADTAIIKLIDPDLLRSALDEQRERIALAEEAKRGIQRLPVDGDVPSEAEIAAQQERERSALSGPTPIGELAKKAAAKAAQKGAS